MPARLWQHRISSFLGLLRHRSIESLEHILGLVYFIASVTMGLSRVKLPACRGFWIECFRDLGHQVVQLSDIFPASFGPCLIYVLKAGLTLLAPSWTSMRLGAIEHNDTKRHSSSANSVDLPIVSFCEQSMPCPIDEEPQVENLLTVARPDRKSPWLVSCQITVSLMPSILSLSASAFFSRRSRVFQWTVLFAAFLRLTMGMPAPIDGLFKASNKSSASAADSLADLAAVVLVVLVLVIAYLLIALKVKSLHVWATLMACSAFGWWCIQSDITASPVLSCA